MSVPLLVFDFARERGKPRRIFFQDPEEVIVAAAMEDVIPALQKIQDAVEAGAFAAGFLSYEAAPAFDPAFKVHSNSSFPLLWFGLCSRSHDGPLPLHQSDYRLGPWCADTDSETFAQDVAAVREAIGRGDTYQVNYTIRLLSQLTGDAFSLYERLRDRQQADFCAYLDIGTHRILSASPELFFHRTGESILTRPMKGTAGRGRWVAEDDDKARDLQASTKDRAENIMIVDMLRNDLGRIAQPGSVEVSRLFDIEQYPTVWQMTSTVQARIPVETSLEAVFRALFPCASVTGAPKVNTMRIIAGLETTPRNIYCGAIGYVTPAQTAIFSVPIRTVLQETMTGNAVFGVGSGITWDSTAELEYAELRAKAEVLASPRAPFSLLETMRLEAGEFALLARHLARLADSSRYFSYAVDLAEVQERLEIFRADAGGGPWRVRLMLSSVGSISVERQELSAWPEGRLSCALSGKPINSADVFLYHKTTHRACYEDQRALYPDAFDTLMVNERDELTEFTLGNVVIEMPDEHGVQRWTPPRDCGLLAGTMRAELLERGAIREKVLTRNDLASAKAVWLINSVRGWVSVDVVA